MFVLNSNKCFDEDIMHDFFYHLSPDAFNHWETWKNVLFCILHVCFIITELNLVASVIFCFFNWSFFTMISFNLYKSTHPSRKTTALFDRLKSHEIITFSHNQFHFIDTESQPVYPTNGKVTDGNFVNLITNSLIWLNI